MSGSEGNIYTPSGTQQSQQNTNATGLLNQSTAGATGYAPAVQAQATDLTQQYINNPYAAGAQTGANTAAAYGTGTAVPQQQQGAASLQALGNNNASYAPQALAAGFDPQNALYNQKFQQNQDQSNAVNAMNGVSGTPYGAGVTNQNNTNFNLDWLNQALGRQSTAAGTAATLTNSANSAYGGAATAGQGAVTNQATDSGLPASTYSQNIAQDIAALSGQNTAISGASGITDQALQSILSYLGYGTSAGTAAAKAQNDEFTGLGQIFGSIAGAAIGA